MIRRAYRMDYGCPLRPCPQSGPVEARRAGHVAPHRSPRPRPGFRSVFLLLTIRQLYTHTHTCTRYEYVLPSCVSSCLLSLVLATCPISAPPSPPGLPRSGTHFHSGGRGATAHTLHRTTRHPRRHGHETYHSDPRIIFEGEGSGVCAQGVAVAPSGAAGAEHLAPAGIHASSRPPAAIKPPRCRVLRRLNICRRTGDA